MDQPKHYGPKLPDTFFAIMVFSAIVIVCIALGSKTNDAKNSDSDLRGDSHCISLDRNTSR